MSFCAKYDGKGDYIADLAREFRKAIEAVVSKKEYGRLRIFERFPKECCRYTSDLLATYLIENGIEKENIQMVESDSKEEGYTHCWLLIDNSFYIDITADQFNGKRYFKNYEPIPTCCMVEKNTYLYENFDNLGAHYTNNVGIDTYGGDVPSKLKEVYDAIKQYIMVVKRR